jgi:antitoxin VapB
MSCIYFRRRSSQVPDRAKLFRTGGSQAVRLPKAYRFQGQREVTIRREGGRVVLESTKRSWSRRFLALAGSAGDFRYPPEPPAVEPSPQLD